MENEASLAAGADNLPAGDVASSAESRVSATRIVERDSSDLASLSTQVAFSLQIFGFWVAGAVISTLTSGALGPLAAVGLLLFWSFISLQLFLGGTARVVAAKMQSEEGQGSGVAWGFIGKYWPGLIGGSLAASAIVSLALIVFLALVYAVSSRSPLAGTLLVQPTFLFSLFSIALLWNCQLLPAVMGVENCSARGAVSRLIGKNPFWLMNTLVGVVVAAMPKIIGTIPFVLVALALTVATTVGLSFDNVGWEQINRPELYASYLASIMLWVAYAASVVASEFALQYYTRS